MTTRALIISRYRSVSKLQFELLLVRMRMLVYRYRCLESCVTFPFIRVLYPLKVVQYQVESPPYMLSEEVVIV